MAEPRIAQKSPFCVTVEAGKSYYWCSCGRSETQPFCDGTHRGSEFRPVAYKAESSGDVYFCGCKRTAGAPLCDGSHDEL